MRGIRAWRIGLALAAVTLAGVVAGLAHAEHPTAQVVGGRPLERQGLARALDRLHVTSGRVEIARGPRPVSGYRGHRKSLTFLGPSDPESQWKDEVAAGVYQARGFQAAWIAIPGLGAGHFHVVRGGNPLGRSGVMKALREAARKSRVRIDRVEILKPLRLAPVVSITVRDLAAFESHGGLSLRWAYKRSHPRLEGIFLIVRGAHGQVISRGGTAFRVGAGAGNWPGSDHG